MHSFRPLVAFQYSRACVAAFMFPCYVDI